MSAMLSHKQQFSIREGVSYLDTAAEGLPPLDGEAALAAYWREKSKGTPGRARLYQEQRELEAAAARLLNTAVQNITLLSHSSEALNLLANSIDWKPGDEVLICDLEFPSNVVVWLRLQRLGVKLVVIPSSHGVIELSDWTARLSSRTRLVSVSQVSYKSGTQIPYMSALAEAAHSAGALFCVDATQALGRVPVSVVGVDYLVASSYKWLLGTHGLAVVYESPELRERIPAATAGWFSEAKLFHSARFEASTSKSTAARLQAGMPNFPAIFALRAGLECLLKVGVERIDQELRPLIAALRSGLEEQGLALLTPAAATHASGIVSFSCGEGEALAASLAEKGVIVWGGDGRVRISLHLYNDGEDVQRCLAAVRACTAGMKTYALLQSGS
ncbi:MAG TPA: aminotransferase class V-fold PLP-dependent enzyme [Bryobacteraceae bacterium]|nr:aminotransferase class V-fold PLP-dependent enzyme [Bryobacteraceae bacterium]